ncbi:MAG: hypothetical protein ACX93U_22100 [Salipiger thiooxidans]|uniref:hypothetical protein n=1 Tax=Salipiger thiooxidans TaxID=282683 RepID=UPI001CFA977A|nr:hypothetical protein [Salipiger thiooxidans]
MTQPYDSPDFRVENRLGGSAWVEAVTANPADPYNHVNAPPSALPADREEAFFGAGALRFAKTIGNKHAGNYDQLPHVKGQPFALAIADFQAPASMIWSREELIGYPEKKSRAKFGTGHTRGGAIILQYEGDYPPPERNLEEVPRPETTGPGIQGGKGETEVTNPS